MEGSVSLQTLRYKYWYCDVTRLQRQAITEVGKPPAGKAIFMRRSIAQEWAREAESHKSKMILETIPEEYKHHWKVFFKEEAKCFPSAREEDMSIKLKEDAPPVINCKMYPLSREECVQLQKFLATEMELG